MSDPLFPFGFGLSYTTFSIANAQICKNEINAGGSVDLTIPVSNTGKRAGTEIVQVYIHKVNDMDGPLKTLKGFKRVKIAAGKSADVNIILPHSSFEFYDKTRGRMGVIPGDYEVLYGNSSDASDLKMTLITIQ
jgi:beta-glucosidase